LNGAPGEVAVCPGRVFGEYAWQLWPGWPVPGGLFANAAVAVPNVTVAAIAANATSFGIEASPG
jgi:hypothetical protein